MASKRTRHIYQATFRKSWHISPIALAISTALMLTGCEKTDENVRLYQNSDDCSRANPGMNEHCVTTYNNALKEAARTAPKYASREDCVAEFGDSQCTKIEEPVSIAGASSPHTNATEQTSAQGGGLWMPLMAGYMMGRMMNNGGGFMQQPLFTSQSTTSQAKGKFVDAGGKSYGPATTGRTITVPGNAMTPKPSVTKTITRGGFGESIAKAEQRNRTTRTESGSRRRNITGG